MEGTSWVCHSISNGSELYPGAVESDRSCAAVYGPDSLQEKWLGFFPSFLFGWVFVSPSQIRTALLHVCLVQSTEHSTAGPNWPLSARKWARAGKHPGRHVPPSPAHWESSAQGCWSTAQSKHWPGGSWKALMTVHVINVPIPAASSAALRPHPAGSSPPSWHQCQHGD